MNVDLADFTQRLPSLLKISRRIIIIVQLLGVGMSAPEKSSWS